MAASYYYKVEVKIVEDQEEKNITGVFKHIDLYIARSDAFEYFDDILKKYSLQFLADFSLLKPYLKLSIIIGSLEYDFDGEFRVDVKREEPFLLYSFSEGCLYRDENNFKLEEKVYNEKGILTNSFTISDIYVYSSEYSIISEFKNICSNSSLFDNSKRNEKFEIVECCKCGKKLEVSKDLICFNPKEYFSIKPKFACKDCIAGFYLTAMDMISFGVYDNFGNPVNKRSPKLVL